MFDKSTFSEAARDTSGSAALEFAILGPAFLMLVLGLIAVGWATFCINSIDLATGKAARYWLINRPEDTALVEAFVRENLAFIAPEQLDVDISTTTMSQLVTATISVTYQLDIDIPFVGVLPISYATTASAPLA